MASHAHRFGEFLREAREKANQTAEVMAILLSMEPEDYLAIEAGLRFPDDDTVRRLCVMMQWNYLETQRLIRNEMSSPTRLTAPVPGGQHRTPPGGQHRTPPGGRHGTAPAGSHGSASGGTSAAGTAGAQRPDSLASRMREVREYTGQSADIIAALLNLAPEQYARLEAGEMPGDDLLRRISMVYNWNYQELATALRSEQARNLQPRLIGSPFPGMGQRGERLRTLCRELEAQFGTLPDAEQDVVLAQLDLIRGTMARHRPKPHAPAPAPDDVQLKTRRGTPAALPPLSPEDRKLFS